MIRIDYFNLFSIENKLNYVKKRGTEIATRKIGYNKVRLYAINNFYVEVWVNMITNFVIKINAFQKVTGLSPYLKRIDIHDLADVK